MKDNIIHVSSLKRAQVLIPRKDALIAMFSTAAVAFSLGLAGGHKIANDQISAKLAAQTQTAVSAQPPSATPN